MREKGGSGTEKKGGGEQEETEKRWQGREEQVDGGECKRGRRKGKRDEEERERKREGQTDIRTHQSCLSRQYGPFPSQRSKDPCLYWTPIYGRWEGRSDLLEFLTSRASLTDI